MLRAHDTMIILKNSLSIPKLMYILRTADCCANKLLTQFDNIVSKGLSTILNLEFSGDQILQASQLVKAGGLCCAPQLFLAATIRLLGFCRRDRGTSSYNPSLSRGEITNRSARFHTKQNVRKMERWKAISGSPPPPDEVYGKQKFWERKLQNSLSA